MRRVQPRFNDVYLNSARFDHDAEERAKERVLLANKAVDSRHGAGERCGTPNTSGQWGTPGGLDIAENAPKIGSTVRLFHWLSCEFAIPRSAQRNNEKGGTKRLAAKEVGLSGGEAPPVCPTRRPRQSSDRRGRKHSVTKIQRGENTAWRKLQYMTKVR